MATKLKLGTDNNWATKVDKLLAYNDENGNFKPIEFDADRDSTSTRVNKSGLVENVEANRPRVQFDNNDGYLLLEPTRSNLMQRSEEFDNSYWTKARSSITANQTTSPDGSNTADKLIDSTDNNTHIVYRSFTVSTSNAYTFSCFLKKGSLSKAFLAFDAAIGQTVVFDLENGTVESEGTGVTSSSIIEYSNDWYKCSLTHTPTTTTRLYRVGTYNGSISYTGTGTDFVYLWGSQLEVGTYATSYIPTTSASVTRTSDTCENAGDVNLFNDTEGVLYAEIKGLADDDTFRFITLSDGTSSNTVRIYLYNAIYGRVLVGGAEQCVFSTTSYNVTDYNKIAILYSENNFKMYVNGSQVGTTDTSGSTFPQGTLDELSFHRGDSQFKFYGNCKNLQVFNEALTDSELQALTS